MSNQGPINSFPVNGQFDESFVGFPILTGDIVAEMGPHTVQIGVSLESVPILDGALEAPQPFQVGVQYNPIQMAAGVEGPQPTADIKVDAQVSDVMEAGLEGPQPASVGVAYTPPQANAAVEFFAPDIQAGFEPTVDVQADVGLDTPFPAGWIISAEGQIGVDIEQQITGLSSVISLNIEQEMFDDGQITQVIEQIIVDPAIQVISLIIEQQMFDDGLVSQIIQQEIVDHTAFIFAGGECERWRAVVTLGGVDISADVTGVIRIEAEETTARVAEFQFRPPAGVIDLTTWINQPVTIDYATLDSAGAIVQQIRLYSGTVDEPFWEPNTGLVKFECTDNFQIELEAMDRATIDALLPGTRWSPIVFDEEVDNYSYALDRLSTLPNALDKGISGSYSFTPWAAKVTPDYTFTDANIVDESVDVEFTSRRDVSNCIKLEFTYRYDRLIEQTKTVKWDFPGPLCSLIQGDTTIDPNGSFTLPNRDMIDQALTSGGWCVDELAITKLPRSSLVSCSRGLIPFIIGDFLRNYLAFGFSAIIKKRYGKGILEKFVIPIISNDSITLYGKNEVERTANVAADYDASEWERDAICETQIGTVLLPESDPLFPSCAAFSDTPTLVEDGLTSRVEVDLAIECEIARGRTDILDNHRLNSVSFQTPLFPLARRDHTLEIDTAHVDARGKVRKFTHTLDLTRGQALTVWELAVSQVGSATDVDTPIVAPTPPDSITPMTDFCTETFTPLPTRYGGIQNQNQGNPLLRRSVPDPGPDAPIEDQFTGYIGNKDPAETGSITYDVRLVVPTDEIDETQREELEVENNTPYTVAVPDELLTLTAPTPC